MPDRFSRAFHSIYPSISAFIDVVRHDSQRKAIKIFERDQNNFTLVRFIAASMVIYSHGFTVSPRDGAVEWISHWAGGVTHAGELSVVIFFFLSGGLITKSLVETVGIIPFVLKRIARIFPALIVVNLLSAYVFSWLFGGGHLVSMVTGHDNWLYFAHNSISLWNEHFIQGVYQDHPNPGLNGALWSVTLEVRLYMVFAALGAVGLFAAPEIRPFVLLGLLLGVLLGPSIFPMLGDSHAMWGVENFPRFSAVFIIGGLAYLFDGKIIYSFKTLIVAMLIMLLCKNTELYLYAIFAVAIILSILVATSKYALSVPLKHDYSYGLYLYGWPSEQIAYALAPGAHPLINGCMAIMIAFTLAMASWHFVERPGLNFVNRRLKSRENLSRMPKNESVASL